MQRGRELFWGQILILLLAAACLLSVSRGSVQSAQAILMPQEFLGEYSRDGVNWLPLDENAELSASDGDLFLRGHLLRDIAAGGRLFFYSSHIGLTASVNGEPQFSNSAFQIMDMSVRYRRDMCGQQWDHWYLPDGLSTDDRIEFTLHNPHAPGNSRAYRDFLSTLCGGPDTTEILKENLSAYGKPFRTLGLGISIVALLLIGASIAAVILHVPVWEKLWKYGVLTCFASGVIYFDAIDISLVQRVIVQNTCGLWLCILLFVLWTGFCALEFLSGKLLRAARAGVLLSAAADVVIIVGFFAGWWLFNDAGIWWAALQLLLCPFLALCCALELRRSDRKWRIFPASCMLLFLTIVLDILGAGSSVISRMNCTKLAFVLVFLIHLARALANVVADHQATIRAKRLERELEESRISIMLSQIKPHFLYNALTSVMDLCDSDPQQAKEAIADFSRYLRGNLSALRSSGTIPFQKELEHIRTYLRLEKLRYKDRLTVKYSIEARHFLLPPLSIQPIVENAVKHGVMKRMEGGTVHIFSREEESCCIVEVRDDGIGFDPEEVGADGQLHIGLENIRGRLRMIGASLDIRSEKGSGTTVVVTIPKERKL